MSDRVRMNTDVGLRRDVNQDCYGTITSGDEWTMVLADGMGGTDHGGEAAKIATFAVVDLLPDAVVPDLFGKAHAAIDGLYGKTAGTTLVVAVWSGADLAVWWIGDSRCYVVTGSGLRQVTKDHTTFQAIVDSRPDMSGEETERMRKAYGHVLTACLGAGHTDATPSVDVSARNAMAAEGVVGVLVCSDGLTDMLTDEQIFDLVDLDDLGKSVDALIAAANEAGGRDNITVGLGLPL